MLVRLAANRAVAARVAPTAVRYYSPPNVRSEGATASSQGFKAREEAQENQYIRRNEEEKLKNLKAKLKQAEADVEAQEKKMGEMQK